MFERYHAEQYQDVIPRLFPELLEKHRPEDALVKNFTFQVTEGCSLCCTYCYQTAKSGRKMSWETAKAVVDSLFSQDDAASKGSGKSEAIILEFIGGEPLLEIRLIDKIVDYFLYQAIRRDHRWAARFMISICSNGVAYFEPEVQDFIRRHQRHLSFSVSIDGNRELHNACRVFPDGSGSYDVAVRAALHYMEHYGGLGSKMTLAPENIAYTFDALKNLYELGYQEIHANCVFERGWTVEHARIYYGQLKKLADWILAEGRERVYLSLFDESRYRPMDPSDNQNWCGGNGRMLSVDCDGVLYPCIRYMPTSLGGKRLPITCGDIRTGVDWRKLEEMQTITRRSQSTDECFYCPIAAGCSWCTAYNYQEFGTINRRATFICEMHKAESLANVYFWNKLYRKHGMTDRFPLHCPREWAVQIVSEEEYKMLEVLTA